MLKNSKIFSKILILLLIISAFILGFFGRGFLSKPENNPTPTPSVSNKNIVLPNLVEGNYKVTRVLDGDTIEINTGEKIRYNGINAPENNERYGITAKEFNEKLVLGKVVKIELDKTKIDIYGRVLAYVWIDGKMVNETLLKEGMAKVETIKGEAKLKYIDKLNAAQTWGEEHHNGIWFDEWIK